VKLPAQAAYVQNASIPEDLVQMQAYIRWEKAGKPNYSMDEQHVKYSKFAFVRVH